ncbi:hypothetical protein JCM6882_002378 [Rhodosporidiobolus microsporus]
MASLPPVPSGVNPFSVYLDALHAEMFPVVPNTKTFAVRVYALVGVCAYGVLISLLYGLSLLFQRRRRSSMWVARKVDGYLTLNLNFFVPFGGALSCLSMLAYTLLQHHIFTLPHPSSSTLYAVNTFRTFSWVPLVLHGYFVAASAAQASLVVSSRARATTTTELERQGERSSFWRWLLRTPSPRTANITFWVGLVAISLALLIPDILFSVSWRRAYTCIGVLEAHLKREAAAWSSSDTLGDSLPALMRTSELYDNLEEEVGKNRVYQRAVIYALILTPLFLAFTTLLASLLLHSLLRLQIRTRAARAVAQSTLLADVHTFASPIASPTLPAQPQAMAMRFEVAFPSARKPSAADVELDDLYEEDEEDDEEERDTDADYPAPHKLVAFKAQPIPPLPLLDSTKAGARPSSPPPFIDFLPVLPSSPPAAAGAATSSESRTRRFSSAPTLFHPPFSRSRRSSSFEPYELGKKRHGSLATIEQACAAVRRARDAVAADEELGELRRAERELGVCATVVLLLTVSLGVENIWNVVRVVPTSFVDLSWTEIETSYFLPPYLYVTIYSLALTLLMAFNSLLTPSSSSSPTSSAALPGAPGSNVDAGSRRPSGMFACLFKAGERRRSSVPAVSGFGAPSHGHSRRRSVVEVLGLGLLPGSQSRRGSDASDV